MPCIAECGGFLYLHRELEDEQHQFHPMVSLYEGRGLFGDRLGRFGYITMRAKEDGLLAKKEIVCMHMNSITGKVKLQAVIFV